MAVARRPRKKKAAPSAAAGLRSAADLRQEAEEHLDGHSAALPVPEELAAVVHELRVHQIELEMQNEELRGAQLELNAQRAKYFELFDLAPVGYLTLSEKGIVGDANLAAAHLLGAERQRLVDRPFSAFIFAPDRDVYYRCLALLKQTAEPHSCELRLRRAGGGATAGAASGHFWARFEGRPQRVADGETLAYRMTFSDVDAQVAAAETIRRLNDVLEERVLARTAELAESEERLRRLFETMTEGVVLIAADGRIVSANPAAERILGLASSEIEGRAHDAPRRELLRPDGTPLPAEEMAGPRALKEKRLVRDVVMGVVQPDGAVFWLSASAAPLLDADGEFEGVVAVFTDITERKQAEEALRQREREFSTLVENAPDMIVRYDADLRLVYCNAAVERQLGVPALARLGKTPLETGGPRKQAELVRKSLRQVLQSGAEKEVEQSLPTPSGEKHFATRIVPERDAKGSIGSLLAITRDVTARKRAEEETARALSLLESTMESTADGLLVVDGKGEIVRSNVKFREMWGIPEAIAAAKDDDAALGFVLDQLEEPEVFLKTVRSLNSAPEEITFDVLELRDGRVFERYSQPQRIGEAVVGQVWSFRDITARKQTEQLLSVPSEILGIIAAPTPVPETVEGIVAALKRATGFDAVGLRLQVGDDYPFVSAVGYSDEFLEAENTLAVRYSDGGVCREKDGTISLECTCGLVLTGKTDPESPLFTPGGSAWTNDSLPFLEAPPEDDPRLHPRNRCIHVGFLSIALVPLRAGEQILGLLHLGDRRKDRFTPESIRFFEGLGASIGVALLGKRAEEALRESEEEYRAVADFTHDWEAWSSPDGSYRWVSPSCERITGHAAAELMADPDIVVQLTHPDDQAKVVEHYRATLHEAREQDRELDFRILTPSGEMRWISHSCTAVYGEDGRWLGRRQSNRDITVRKQAEEKVARTLSLLESTMEATGDGILVANGRGGMVRSNMRFREIWGIPEAIAAAKDDDAALSFVLDQLKEPQRFLEGVRDLYGAPERTSFDVLELKDGRVFERYSQPQRIDGSVVGRVWSFRDVTARRRAADDMAQLNAELVSETAALAEANATITRIAATDDLTGLANRRHFYESLTKAASLARRHGSPLAVVSLDLDGLKRVNDGAGHAAGDEVLSSFAALLTDLCRAEDLPGRLGGDEFSVLLPGMDLGGGRGLAERLLAAVRSCAALTERGVTVSGGVAAWTPDESPEDLLRRADQALYAAKRGGGDAVNGDG